MRQSYTFSKIQKAGFKIIRTDDLPSPRIKEWKSDSAWITVEKFGTKAERDRRFEELLQDAYTVTL